MGSINSARSSFTDIVCTTALLHACFLIVRYVERGTESFGEVAGRCDTPVVQEHNSGLLSDHMLMDCDDVDTRRAQSLQNILKLCFTHREITVDDSLVVTPGERAPGVHSHLIANRDIVHPRRSADYEFVHPIFVLTLEAED